MTSGRRLQALIKRLIDVSGAAAGLVALAAVCAGTAAAIRLTMGRPVVFSQRRVGGGGKPFVLYKFRTMRPPQPGEEWNRTDRERLTGLGRLLRRFSIDELPELWNVLKGDMSLVGPRPLPVEYMEIYTPEQKRRHEVKPGITGWAQINGRQRIPFSRRLALDIWYVDHRSLWLDLKILAKTPLRVFTASDVIVEQDLDDVDDVGIKTIRDRFIVK